MEIVILIFCSLEITCGVAFLTMGVLYLLDQGEPQEGLTSQVIQKMEREWNREMGREIRSLLKKKPKRRRKRSWNT